MSAKIELGYTKIYAEIDGRMGKATYSPGNYVTPSSNPLVTLVQVTPVNIRFPVSERDLLTMFGSVKGVREKAELRIRTADGKMHDGWTELRWSTTRPTLPPERLRSGFPPTIRIRN